MQSDIAGVIGRLKKAGVKLELRGEQLVPAEGSPVLAPELAAELSTHYDGLVALLHRYRDTRADTATAPSQTEFALSGAQLAFWWLEKMRPGSLAHKLVVARDLAREAKREPLAAAVSALAARHPMLRTVFRESPDGDPRQFVLDSVGPEIGYADLHESGPDAELDASISEVMQRPFALAHIPPIRFQIVSRGRRCTLVVVAHHLICDGWSMSILLKELFHLYNAAVNKKPSRLKPVLAAYADYVAWQNNRTTSAAYAACLRYWRSALQDLPPALRLPSDQGSATRINSKAPRRVFSSALVQEAEKVARALDATGFVVLLMAYAIVTARFSGRDQFCIGFPVAGRNRPELLPIVGCFADTLAVKIDFREPLSLREHLVRLRDQVFAALAHQDLPFHKLVEELHPVREPGEQPIFQVMFALHTEKRQMKGPSSGLGSKSRSRSVEKDGTGYQLFLDLYPAPQGELACVTEHDRYRVHPDLVGQMLSSMDFLLRGLSQQLDRPLAQLALAPDSFPDAEPVSCDELVDVYQLFSTRSNDRPDTVAVQHDDASITYAELHAKAQILGSRLREHGIGPGRLVGVLFSRCIDQVMAIFAVLSCGASYLPLDPTHPPQRIKSMLADARPGALLYESESGDEQLLDATIWDTSSAAGPGPRIAVLRDAVSAPACDRTVAYAIFTSGSTGAPKAALITRRGLSNMVQHMRDAHAIALDDAVLSVTPPSFDLGGLDLLMALCCGARLVIATAAQTRDGDALLTLMRSAGVTIFQATPTTWELLHAACEESVTPITKALRVAICGGEAMRPGLVPFLCDFAEEAWNYYGPTETTVWSTSQRLTRDGVTAVGRPIANTMIHVVDDHATLQPPGAPGEVWIGGGGVALGYLGRPELTAQRFVRRHGILYYRTGDLGRIRADGNLEIAGRNDRQVKIRGYRIELSEVESALASVAGIQAAHAFEHSAYPDTLCSAVLRKPGASGLSTQRIREDVGSLLPRYMVPDILFVADDVRVTPNGKLDWAAIVRESKMPGSNTRSADSSVLTPDEAQLAGIWRQLLGVDHVSASDDFFSLGGHSLLLLKLHHAIRSEIRRDIALHELFRHSILRDMATLLARAARVGAASHAEMTQDEIDVTEFLRVNGHTASQTLPSPHQYIKAISVDVAEAEVAKALDVLEGRYPLLRMCLRWDPRQGQILLVRGQKKSGFCGSGDDHHPGKPFDSPMRLSEALYRAKYVPSGPASASGTLFLQLDTTFFDAESGAILGRAIKAILAQHARPSTSDGLRRDSHFLDALRAGHGKVPEAAIRYWSGKATSGSLALDLRLDRPAVFTRRAKRLFRTLPPQGAAQVRAAATAHGCAPSLVFLSAYAYVLGRAGGCDEVAVSVKNSIRRTGPFAEVIGPYDLDYYLRVKVSEPALDRHMRNVLGEFRESLSYSNVPVPVVWGPVPWPSPSMGLPISACYFHNEGDEKGARGDSGTTNCDWVLTTSDGVDGHFDLTLKYYADAIPTAQAQQLLNDVVTCATSIKAGTE